MLLCKGTELSYQERECKLYNEFVRFTLSRVNHLYDLFTCALLNLSMIDTIGMDNAQESGQVLEEEQLAFLVDPGVADGQATQITIPHNVAFQTDDLDAYDSDCDDISSAKAVLMANLSSYDSDVLSEVPQHVTYQNDDMLNQSVQQTQCFEPSLIDYVPNSEIKSDSNIISYEQCLQEKQNAIV
ncbi:hypothetical protein Tco_0636064 [Tanacetum coccineum]